MYSKILLDNGIPVIMETTKDTRSVCVGIWVKAGARYEPAEKTGISHFLEHMFFKGTRKRSAMDIALEIDSIGGELNAFTSRESTTFYTKVLDEDLEKGLELIIDLFLNSTFAEKEVQKEKGVITDEISQVEDTPEEYIYDLFNRSIWGDSGLGRPVLGTREHVTGFTRDDLEGYLHTFYGKSSIIFSCSGNFDPQKLTEALNRTLGTIERESGPVQRTCPEFRGGLNIVYRDLSEVHLCLGVKGISHGEKSRYAMHLLNSIFGAGVSSRLFLEIREKRGLAYSIGSSSVSYSDTGVWTVYTGTDRKHVGEVIQIILDQMRNLTRTVTREELQKAKSQCKGNLMLGLESTTAKMINIAKQEMYYGKYYSPEDIMRSIEAVTLDELRDLSRRLTEGRLFAINSYGPLRPEELEAQGPITLSV